MKKIIVLILSVVMTFSLLAAAGSVSADSMQVKVERDGGQTVFQAVDTARYLIYNKNARV